jgi:flagellar basal-body rod modification protein FlgD
MALVHPLAQTNPASNATGNTGSAGGDGSTISANDFLTLLVTEMKNQDPTAQTDPNQYINQLVQVNSLEQLIQINQTLNIGLQGTSGSGAGSGTGQAVHAPQWQSAIPAATGQTDNLQQGVGVRSDVTSSPVHGLPVYSGNLSVPPAIPAAERVAEALSGRK